MSSVPPAQRGGHAVSSLASRSLMTTAATNNGMTKKFIFGSEWHFLPEGVKSLTQRFNKVLENKDLVCLFFFVWFISDMENTRTAIRTGRKPCCTSTASSAIDSIVRHRQHHPPSTTAPIGQSFSHHKYQVVSQNAIIFSSGGFFLFIFFFIPCFSLLYTLLYQIIIADYFLLQDATLEWNAEDATFRISCLHPISNQVWDIFSKIVQDFIAQESGCDLDDSDDESYVGESKDDSTGNESAPVC